MMNLQHDRASRVPLQFLERTPLQDHCGIIAAFSPKDVAFLIPGIAGLIKLQTRGYDGAGFASISREGGVHQYRAEGMITDAFDTATVISNRNIPASSWVFQTRYGTTGAIHIENLQPIVCQHKCGEFFALAHNGQFCNEPDAADSRRSDTVMFASQLAETGHPTWDERILHVHNLKKGAWSVAVATGKALYLLRDPHGIRPLAYGQKIIPGTNERVWIAASETAALTAMGVAEICEVLPGSVVKIDVEGPRELQVNAKRNGAAACMFENIYLGDGSSVLHRFRVESTDINSETTINEFRRRCGQILAQEEPPDFIRHVDLVIGVPGTGISGGQAYAHTLGLPYVQAIADRKPQYQDARTFMTPDIEKIPHKITEHFYVEENLLKDSRLVLVDDSLVRGNITKGLVSLLKIKYGVRTVHIRILCPPIDKPCYLGINTRQSKELIAARHNGNIAAMNGEIGSDSLAFLSHAGLIKAAGAETSDGFCLGCMVGYNPPISRSGAFL